MAILRVNKYGKQQYLTIQDAVDNANPGDKIIVDSDEYYGNVTINKSNISIEGLLPSSGASCALNAPKLLCKQYPVAFVLDNVSNVSIKGFKIQNFSHAVVGFNSHNIAIENNSIAFAHTPVAIHGSDTVSVSRNNIVRYGLQNMNAIDVRNCSNVVIDSNIISAKNAVSGAIFVMLTGDTFSNFSVKQNEIDIDATIANILFVNTNSTVMNVEISENKMVSGQAIWMHQADDKSVYGPLTITNNICAAPKDTDVKFYYDNDRAIINDVCDGYSVEKYSGKPSRIWKNGKYVEVFAADVIFDNFAYVMEMIEPSVMFSQKDNLILLNKFLFAEKFHLNCEEIKKVILVYLDENRKKTYVNFSGKNSTMISNVIIGKPLVLDSIIIERFESKMRIPTQDLIATEWNLTVS